LTSRWHCKETYTKAESHASLSCEDTPGNDTFCAERSIDTVAWRDPAYYIPIAIQTPHYI
jgi:hypothetical protein